MKIIYLPSLSGSEYLQQVWQLVCEADGEFVPPLSHRESTTQSVLTDGSASHLPESYFNELKEQEILIALDGELVAGIMSFRRGCDGIEGCSVYVSTVIVSKELRGRKICESLYKRLFEAEKGLIVTRTWSLNAPHIHILNKLGFELIKTIKNHRGKGIDTVYYGKESV